MAKSANQKLKLLHIVRILEENTDEDHCISTQELIRELAKYDIAAERKSIYSDMEQLERFGYDIVYVKAKSGGGYYLAGRRFELPELKLLVDAVQSSRFLTLKKSLTGRFTWQVGLRRRTKAYITRWTRYTGQSRKTAKLGSSIWNGRRKRS